MKNSRLELEAQFKKYPQLEYSQKPNLKIKFDPGEESIIEIKEGILKNGEKSKLKKCPDVNFQIENKDELEAKDESKKEYEEKSNIKKIRKDNL